MRYILTSLAFFLVSGLTQASVAVPSPEMDLGPAGFVMVAGAAYLARRRRRG
jgi:MYXO-CTERM domain-containing protein